MDPHAHQLSTMDPKLKEAYQKVMAGGPSMSNTPTNATPPANPAPGINTDKPTETIGTSQPKMIVEEEKPATETPPKPVREQSVIFTGGNKQHGTGTIHIGYSAKPGQKLHLEKKKLGIPPALYIVGCVLFFMLYSIFWIKVFGISLPFLP